MSTILIGVDATARSEDAVALARQLAHPLTGDVVVAAITHDRTAGHAAVRRMAGLLGPGIEPDRIRTALDDAVAGTSAETVVLDGRPWAALAAKSEELDLLLVGSRGYGPLKAVITGGTSGPLIHHAHCPVVVLPRGVDAPLHRGAEALLG